MSAVVAAFVLAVAPPAPPPNVAFDPALRASLLDRAAALRANYVPTCRYMCETMRSAVSALEGAAAANEGGQHSTAYEAVLAADRVNLHEAPRTHVQELLAPLAFRAGETQAAARHAAVSELIGLIEAGLAVCDEEPYYAEQIEGEGGRFAWVAGLDGAPFDAALDVRREVSARLCAPGHLVRFDAAAVEALPEARRALALRAFVRRQTDVSPADDALPQVP